MDMGSSSVVGRGGCVKTGDLAREEADPLLAGSFSTTSFSASRSLSQENSSGGQHLCHSSTR